MKKIKIIYLETLNFVSFQFDPQKEHKKLKEINFYILFIKHGSRDHMLDRLAGSS